MKKRLSAVVVAAIYGLPMMSLAADEQQEGAKADEEVIVTGVAQPTTKLSSSNSVTALHSDEITNFAPRSTAEIFRNLPGIQAEATGGDSNANIKVRGMPISAGGARYLSIQEDSLPVLLVGDMDFATSDSFLRFDNNIRSVQSIRGGAGATQASNAAGGIINFLSKTGAEQGGSIGVTAGVDYSSNRLDFDYGAPAADGWSWHAGGYYRQGEGPRSVPDDIETGGQIKATVNKDFERGFARVHLKKMNDRSPTYLPIPARYNGSGYDEVGVAFGDGTLYLNGNDTLNRTSGRQTSSLTTGFEADVTSLGLEGEFDITDSTTIGLKHRNSTISGQFVSPFPAELYTDVDGDPAARIHYFNTKLNSLDNMVTDLYLKQKLSTANIKAGIFHGVQDYNAEWGWNTYFRKLDGNLTPTSGPAGEASFMPGHPFWGDCCQRKYDMKIENTAPHIAVTADLSSNFTMDASVRQDTWKVTGTKAEATAGPDADGYLTYGAASPVDYQFSYTSASVGGNFSLNDDSAIFAAYSMGGSATAPSRVTGSLLANGSLNGDKSGYSTVNQFELGYKYRGDAADLYVTLFSAETAEAGGFEVTTQKVIENTYSSNGVEVEGAYDFSNGFTLNGGFTLTKAEITKSNDSTVVGNKPRRQADYIFNITPAYNFGSNNVGLNFVGTDAVYVQDSNKAQFDGFVVTNLFWNYDIARNMHASLNVNNLLDQVGFTEGEVGNPAAGDLVQVRPINGRTTSISFRYDLD